VTEPLASAARARARVPKIWGGVPQQNKNFTGRDDLLGQLRAGLATETTAVRAVLPQALHGMGGVGKTQLAIEYAYRFRSEYDLVWWVSADQPKLVPSSLASLAPGLDLPEVTATGIQDAAKAVLNALRRGEPYDQWLLIYDNADQPEDLAEYIPRGNGHVLITSRNPRWQGIVETVEVDVFNRAESVDFLNKRVPRSIQEADADRLAQELGDLPLALEQAGALQAETGMSIEEYLVLLKEKASELLAESKPSEYPVPMTAAWQLSVSKLKERQPAALELLNCCAFFGPDPIPRDVFGRGARSDRQQLGEILSDPILLTRIIRELGRYALIKIDTENRTVQVHRLIQALLRDELPEEEQVHLRHEVHLLLAGASRLEPDDGQNWPRFAALVPHVEPSELTECRDQRVREFALDLVRYLYRSGDHQSARTFVERSIRKWTADSGEDNREVLAAHLHHGNILRELGLYQESYAETSAALERARRVLGPDDQLTLWIANSFGGDLRAHGDFAAAGDNDEDVLRLQTATVGESNSGTLRAMNNLALDYGLISQYVQARDLHRRAYSLQSRVGEQTAKVALLISWNGLARAVRLCGSYTEARDVGEEAYEYGRQELGSEHRHTLLTAKDLSIALRRMGKYDEALELARDMHDRCQRLFGAGHPDTLAAATSLSNILRTIGQADEGFAVAEDATKRYPAVYGDQHPYYHGCAGNLALLRRERGDVTGARELDEASLAGLEARLGRDHHYSLTVATNLASDLAMLGDVHAARELGEDTLRRLRVLLGNDHPMTLGCAANLSIDRRKDDAEDEADALAEDTLDRYYRTLGPEHPDAKVAKGGNRLDFDFDPPPI
jgi:tetratricopeptide (TPR) repeat protein